MINKLHCVGFFYRFINNLEEAVHSSISKSINGAGFLLQWDSNLKQINYRNLFWHERAEEWQMSFYITKSRKKVAYGKIIQTLFMECKVRDNNNPDKGLGNRKCFSENIGSLWYLRGKIQKLVIFQRKSKNKTYLDIAQSHKQGHSRNETQEWESESMKRLANCFIRLEPKDKIFHLQKWDTGMRWNSLKCEKSKHLR